MNILVTGGAGYIGSHTVIELVHAGHTVVILDNFVNSSLKVMGRVEQITRQKVVCCRTDLRDRASVTSVFAAHGPFDACIHFAALKSVGDSVRNPLEYYENNIGGTLVLMSVMREYGCRNFIFSSSATVYGEPVTVPITEDCPRGDCTNPYGRTKSMLEDIIADMHTAEGWNVVLLRYFNPIGAHRSGLIGENPNGTPNNLMPYITQVAVGKRDKLHIYGNDYNTPDGTGVRDYIHVVDLARGHVMALEALGRGLEVYNLGTGRGYSVLEIVKAFEEANGVKIPYVFDARRPGDVAVCYSDPSKAKRELGWEAEYGILDMCRDSWNWQRQNPNGL